MERRVDEWVQERLRWEDWARLLKHGVAFAEAQIRRRRWRGDRAGVLPEGQDANGVVKRQEIARRLGIGVAAVSAARKRLERKLGTLSRSR